MDLGERIALLRRQASLSQEQLGEKLGVSRQAVSKWESGQANPDLQYVMALCRLFEISSDYLLFGEEGTLRELPAQCPGCGGIVTAMDAFCPKCGRSLRQEEGYCLVLSAAGSLKETVDAIDQIFWLGVTPDFETPEGWFMTPERAAELAAQGPMILGYMDEPAAAEAVNRIMDLWAPGLQVYRREEGKSARQYLESGKELARKDFVPKEHKEPMSFGATVGAVALGVLAAAVLLMFL